MSIVRSTTLTVMSILGRCCERSRMAGIVGPPWSGAGVLRSWEQPGFRTEPSIV